MDTTLESNNTLATEDYFLLATRKWDDKLEDYLPVSDPSTTTQTFDEYADAETAYFAVNYQSCPQAEGKDIKLELLHMRYNVRHMVRNRILFP